MVEHLTRYVHDSHMDIWPFLIERDEIWQFACRFVVLMVMLIKKHLYSTNRYSSLSFFTRKLNWLHLSKYKAAFTSLHTSLSSRLSESRDMSNKVNQPWILSPFTLITCLVFGRTFQKFLIWMIDDNLQVQITFFAIFEWRKLAKTLRHIFPISPFFTMKLELLENTLLDWFNDKQTKNFKSKAYIQPTR